MIKRTPLKRIFKPIKRVSDRQKEKNTERTQTLHEWFQLLWDKLPVSRYCTICGTPIYGLNKPIYWDHLIEKQNRWDIAFEEWNICFCCGDCHTKRSNGFPLPKHQELINKAIEYDKSKGKQEENPKMD